MKNNHNKFNKTINPSGNEPPLGWWKFFFYRCGHYVLEPIWANEKDYEEQAKRKPNETVQQYEARAYPPEYVKDYQEREKKMKEELTAKRMEEEKQKKLIKKRDQVNALKRLIEENQTELGELKAKNIEGFSEYQKEHQSKIDYCEEVIPIYKARLTDSNYLDLYWDELSQ